MQANKINILSQETIEKIAAGEVIERPASIVKELLENSIDAGSENISLYLTEGGNESICIIDDGCGMNEEDVKLSVKRHATSKIEKSEDLFNINTLGFRGEALASISAVSIFKIETAEENGKAYCLEVEGGIQKDFSLCARSKGTTITIKELFYNMPARKKFLKTARSELNKILEVVEETAMNWPKISFLVKHKNRELINLPIASDFKERLDNILGEEISANSTYFDYLERGVHVHGLLGHPQIAKNNSKHQHLFVNGRPISDRKLQFSVKRAYRELIPGDKFPVFVLFLELDPQTLDVNVHPAKREVRFSDEHFISGVVFSAVSKSIMDTGFSTTNFSHSNQFDYPLNSVSDFTHKPQTNELTSDNAPSYSDTISSWNKNKTERKEDSDLSLFSHPTHDIGQESYTPLENYTATETFDNKGSTEKQHAHEVEYLQLHKLYILTPIKNGLLMVDQHAAHERILYEKALKDLENSSATSQQLLFPVVIKLSTSEYNIVESTIDHFKNLGFDIKFFDSNSIAIEGSPPLVSVKNIKETINDMISYLLENANNEISIHDNFAKSFACGAAIKAGDKLALEEMTTLIDTLFSTKNPYTCPHGRPTVIRLSNDEISKRFLR